MNSLLVGYGNPLRGDDGLGWHAVEEIVRRGRVGGTRLMTRHQLTPELAADIAEASFVVFVDARPDDGGCVEVGPVTPAAAGEPAAWSHHLTPASVLALAAVLYGCRPVAWLVTAPAAATDASEALSAPMRALLPDVVAAVEGLIGALVPAGDGFRPRG